MISHEGPVDYFTTIETSRLSAGRLQIEMLLADLDQIAGRLDDIGEREVSNAVRSRSQRVRSSGAIERLGSNDLLRLISKLRGMLTQAQELVGLKAPRPVAL